MIPKREQHTRAINCRLETVIMQRQETPGTSSVFAQSSSEHHRPMMLLTHPTGKGGVMERERLAGAGWGVVWQSGAM